MFAFPAFFGIYMVFKFCFKRTYVVMTGSFGAATLALKWAAGCIVS